MTRWNSLRLSAIRDGHQCNLCFINFYGTSFVTTGLTDALDPPHFGNIQHMYCLSHNIGFYALTTVEMDESASPVWH